MNADEQFGQYRSLLQEVYDSDALHDVDEALHDRIGIALGRVGRSCLCGDLSWTVYRYGRITHKEMCPARTDPWSQSEPERQS